MAHVVGWSQTVNVCFRSRKAAGSLLYHGKRFGKDLLKPAGQSARIGDRGKLLFPFGGLGSQSII